MKNFTLDYSLTLRLNELSDKTDLSRIEILEKMFELFEEELIWQEWSESKPQKMQLNKVQIT